MSAHIVHTVLLMSKGLCYQLSLNSTNSQNMVKVDQLDNYIVCVCVLQISYASTSVALSDRSVYHSFFRTIPSDETVPTALSAVLSHHDWRTLAIAAEDGQQFNQVESVCISR